MWCTFLTRDVCLHSHPDQPRALILTKNIVPSSQVLVVFMYSLFFYLVDETKDPLSFSQAWNTFLGMIFIVTSLNFSCSMYKWPGGYRFCWVGWLVGWLVLVFLFYDELWYKEGSPTSTSPVWLENPRSFLLVALLAALSSDVTLGKTRPPFSFFQDQHTPFCPHTALGLASWVLGSGCCQCPTALPLSSGCCLCSIALPLFSMLEISVSAVFWEPLCSVTHQ